MNQNNNMISQNIYSRSKAVNYALKYALHPNTQYRYFPLFRDTSGDCANFISQCLKAGGAPMIHSINNSWWYNHNGRSSLNDTWSLSWTVANALFILLKENYRLKRPGPKGMEVYNIYQLKLGDLVFYEDANRVIFHSAIVTGFSNIPLVSHHSYEALNIPYNISYTAKKIHLIKVSL